MYILVCSKFKKKMEFPDEGYRDICNIKTLYSPNKGFFNDFVNIMMKEIDQNWIKSVFLKQNSDVDKIRICCHDAKVWSAIREILRNVSKVYRKKSSEAAKQSLNEGDLLIELGDYKKAVMVYSQSLIRAPLNNAEGDESFDRETLPMAYVGRANALFHLGRYQECLKDLNMALREKVPNRFKHRIFRQMGKCYLKLGERERGLISLQVSLKLLEEQISSMQATASRTKQDKNKEEILKKAVHAEKEEIQKIIKQKPDEKEVQKHETPYCGTIPELDGTPNDRYPSASSLVKIRQSEEAGRFAAASDRIEVGSTLLVEEPQASVLISPMLSSHCLHCFTRLLTPVPCPTCSGVAFCSSECRDSAVSSYHRHECELLGLFLGSGMSVLSHLAFRMVTQESLNFFKVLLSKLQSSSPPEAFTRRETEYMQVYNLTTHSGLRTGEDYFRRALMAIFLVECLKKTEFFGPDPKTECFSEDEMLTASIILRHLQLLQFNAHEIYETRVFHPKQARDSKAVYIGVAIYPTAALFNHECAPSVTRYFNGKKIVVKAVRPMEKNDVLSENYGPNHGKKSLTERTRELTSRYWFKCTCKACLEDWPKIENLTEDNLVIRCSTPRCAGTFERRKLKNKSDSELKCSICLQKTNLKEVLEKKKKLDELFEKSLDLMDEGKYDEAVTFLSSYLNKTFRLIAPPSREMFLTQEALRTCFAQTGNVWVLN